MVIMLFTTSIKAQYNLPSHYDLNLNGFVVDTMENGFGIYLPNDIITVMPVYTLDTVGMMFVVVSEVGPIIHTLGCECDVKPFIKLLLKNPISRDESKDAKRFYHRLIADKWKD